MTALTSSQLFADLSDQQTEMIRGGEVVMKLEKEAIERPIKKIIYGYIENDNIEQQAFNNGHGNNDPFGDSGNPGNHEYVEDNEIR